MFRPIAFALIAATGLTAVGPAMAADAPVTWTLQTPAGASVSFPEAREGPVILLFWATWCPFCKALMPHLQSIVYEYPGDALTIYAIHFRDDDGDPVGYMRANGFDFTVLLDGGEVAAAYGVHATPGLLVFDRDNHKVFDIYDAMDEFNSTYTLPDGLKNRQKAARKAPFWAAEIRKALDAASR
ncbi:MAG: TlpA family protein disulfide reductase [Gammaproteobacteria bacterium]